MNLFQQSLAFTLSWEGGYSNDPKDKGGATNYGITQSTYDAWQMRSGGVCQDVKCITTEEVETIYEEQYWKRNYCILMPYPLCTAVFDTCVNLGGNGVKILQRMVDTPDKQIDGIMGPKTLSRLRVFTQGEGEVEKFTERYLVNRAAYYRALKNPHFEDGWLNRTKALAKYLNLPEIH